MLIITDTDTKKQYEIVGMPSLTSETRNPPFLGINFTNVDFHHAKPYIVVDLKDKNALHTSCDLQLKEIEQVQPKPNPFYRRHIINRDVCIEINPGIMQAFVECDDFFKTQCLNSLNIPLKTAMWKMEDALLASRYLLGFNYSIDDEKDDMQIFDLVLLCEDNGVKSKCTKQLLAYVLKCYSIHN
jgi:hypothetical protein